MQQLNCRHCNSENTFAKYSNVPGYNIEGLYSIIGCRDCGIHFTYPYLSKEEAEAYYDQQEIAFNGEGGHDLLKDFQGKPDRYWHNMGYFNRHNEIVRSSPQAKSILDVGCGAGIFLALCMQKGLDVTGLELSKWGYESANQLGIPVKKLTIQDYANSHERKFDIVTMYDVLEHGENPMQDLRAAASLLNPGGLLIVNLPNLDGAISRWAGPNWNKLIPPNHTYHFGQQSLKKILTDAGFKIDSVSTNSGSPSEFIYQAVTGFWWRLGRTIPAIDGLYRQRLTPVAQTGKNPLMLSIKGSHKIAPKLGFLVKPITPMLDFTGRGEGLHMVARKV